MGRHNAMNGNTPCACTVTGKCSLLCMHTVCTLWRLWLKSDFGKLILKVGESTRYAQQRKRDRENRERAAILRGNQLGYLGMTNKGRDLQT